MLELALIITLFSLLVLAAIDIGRLYGVNEQVTNAAHEGAKLAAQYYSPSSGYTDNSTIAGYVRGQIVQEGLLDSNKITSLTVTEPPAYTEESVVSVSVGYRFSFYGPWALFPGLSNISIFSTSAEAIP